MLFYSLKKPQGDKPEDEEWLNSITPSDPTAGASQAGAGTTPTANAGAAAERRAQQPKDKMDTEPTGHHHATTPSHNSGEKELSGNPTSSAAQSSGGSMTDEEYARQVQRGYEREDEELRRNRVYGPHLPPDFQHHHNNRKHRMHQGRSGYDDDMGFPPNPIQPDHIRNPDDYYHPHHPHHRHHHDHHS